MAVAKFRPIETSQAFPTELGKLSQMYYTGIHDNLLFYKTWYNYNPFYDLFRCKLDFIKFNDIPKNIP